MLSTAGEPWLGGDDCDSEIAAALRGELRLGSGEGGAGCSDAELRPPSSGARSKASTPQQALVDVELQLRRLKLNQKLRLLSC